MHTSPAHASRISLVVGVLLMAGLLAGCSGAGTIASSWPGLAVDETTAYVAFGPAVYAIDLATGQERWRFPAERDAKVNFYAAPALTGEGHLIVGGYDKVVYCLSAADGTLSWTFDGSTDRIVGAPVVAGDLVLVPSADRHLYALRLSNGSAVWSFETGHSLWGAICANTAAKNT